MTHTSNMIAEAHFRIRTGATALIGIEERPHHADPFARYLVYASIDGAPWSCTVRSLEEAQTQARAWRDQITSQYGYALCDPFGEAATANHVTTVCNPDWRLAREL